MRLAGRVAALLALLAVPLLLALASQTLAARPGAPSVPDQDVRLGERSSTAGVTAPGPSLPPSTAPSTAPSVAPPPAPPSTRPAPPPGAPRVVAPEAERAPAPETDDDEEDDDD